MKKLLLIVCLLAFISLRSSAGSSDLFSIDEDQIKSEMSELNQLEQFIEQNEGVTFTTLQSENNELIANVTNDYALVSSSLNPNNPMGTVPAFLWGFCLGPIGVIIAYFIDEDNLLWSLVGCLVSSSIAGGGWLFR